MLTFYKDTFKTSFNTFFFYIFAFSILTILFIFPPLYLFVAPIISFMIFLIFHIIYVYFNYKQCFELLKKETTEGLTDNLIEDYKTLAEHRKNPYEAVNDNVNIAQIYLARNNPVAALNILSETYQKYPNYFDIPCVQINYNYTLLISKLKAGFNITNNEINRVIAHSDNAKDYSTDLEMLQLYMQAIYYNKQYEYSKAIECLNKKIELTKKYNYKFPVHEMLADTYLEYVTSYVGLNQYKKAAQYIGYAKQYSKTHYMIDRIKQAELHIDSARSCA